jgi:hypothetical protein
MEGPMELLTCAFIKVVMPNYISEANPMAKDM